MPDYTLVSAPPLKGYDRSFDELRLRAPDGLSIVSLAMPMGGESDGERAIRDAYGVDLPVPGKSVLSTDGGTRLVRLSPDAGFAIFSHNGPDARTAVAEKLDDAFYLTDQTDVWTGLEISGARARVALERICPIDLHPEVFAEHDAARTVMEHLGTLIIRTGADTYLLLSASSSAKSFLHALETSIHNTA